MDLLPNFKNAVVDIRKLKNYCLNSNHPVGKHKAHVFKSELEIDQDDAEFLKELILSSLSNNPARINFEDKFGVRYTVDIKISILGNDNNLTTGWIIRSNENFPRLTTCYLQT